jgi:hypothetical protein
VSAAFSFDPAAMYGFAFADADTRRSCDSGIISPWLGGAGMNVASANDARAADFDEVNRLDNARRLLDRRAIGCFLPC